ncbi:MAG: ATP-binding protein [Synechococcales cyanobacterium RM1_1_8]|nr:ATP-binding protein [Synechococcales cyanobacterium RM1_1_8]
MPRWFNTAGPCKPDIHYMLSPLERLPNLTRLIEQQGYFIIHAPRQTGKTTAMLDLAQQLTASGGYAALMVSAESGSALPHDPRASESFMLKAWLSAARVWLPPALQPQSWEEGSSMGQVLQQWSQVCPRAIVLFIDEIDSLEDETLITVLRQLRDGFPRRPEGFPQSIALVGLRDVRDYKVASGGSGRLNTASPFNIKVASLTLRNFNQTEIAALYQQHTDDTGQVFTDAAIARAFHLTQGQPWLVNALAKEIVEELLPDGKTSIQPEQIDQAKEILIQRRDTHIDSLAERLQDPRVRAIIQPIIAGQILGPVPPDDVQFLIDLGLLERDPAGGLRVANPIYQEVIPRVLTNNTQDALPAIHPTWLTAEGELDETRLLEAFLTFWRQHGQPLLRNASYHEIAPHLVLMAFLHRVVNGEGRLDREYAIGNDRLDLCLSYRSTMLAMELKVWRAGASEPLAQGLAQLDRYLAGLGLGRGWLVIFDQRPELPPLGERTTTEFAQTPTGRAVTVIRA